jgi:hypothetical protein
VLKVRESVLSRTGAAGGGVSRLRCDRDRARECDGASELGSLAIVDGTITAVCSGETSRGTGIGTGFTEGKGSGANATLGNLTIMNSTVTANCSAFGAAPIASGAGFTERSGSVGRKRTLETSRS